MTDQAVEKESAPKAKKGRVTIASLQQELELMTQETLNANDACSRTETSLEEARQQIAEHLASREELAGKLSEAHRALEKMTADRDDLDRRLRDVVKTNCLLSDRITLLRDIGTALSFMLVVSGDPGDLNLLNRLLEASGILEVETPVELVPEFVELITSARAAHLKYQVESLKKRSEKDGIADLYRELGQILQKHDIVV